MRSAPLHAALLIAILPAASVLAAPDPGPAPAIDLYTMGPGEDPFTRFGHAAICVTDERSPRGRCYNYGTADFSTPVPLTWNFIRGRALFWVSVQDLPRMVASYVAQDRTLYRQRLPLAPAQARALADTLEASTAQQVRYYRYHHFHDNCTTRIRDLIDRATGGVLSRDAANHAGPTFRSFAREGFAGDLPLLLAAELLLGRPADERTSPWQAMFLPEIFRREVAARLGAAPEIVYARRAPPPSGSTLLGRAALIVAGAALALALVGAARTGRRALRAALVVTGLALGLLALVLWLLAILSSFTELRWNEILLCLWPTDLALGLLPSGALERYLRLRLAALLATGVFVLVGPLIQPLGAPLLFCLIPLVAAHKLRNLLSNPIP